MDQKILDLGAVKAEIISHSAFLNGPFLPALALKVKSEMKPVLDEVKKHMDNHDAFEISKVLTHDERWTKLFLESKGFNEETNELKVTLLIPTSMLTVAFALMFVPGSFSLMLLGSTSVRLEGGMVLDNRKRILSDIYFPPLTDARHGLIQQTLASTTGNVYTGPLIPRGLVSQEVAAHFEVDDFGVNSYARAAQGRLLSILSSLTRGDVVAGSMALNLAKQLEEVYQFDLTDDLSVLSPDVCENINIYRNIVKYLVSALLSSTPLEKPDNVPLEEITWEPRDFNMEDSFVEIVSSFLQTDAKPNEGSDDAFSAWTMKYTSVLPGLMQEMRVPYSTDNIPAIQQGIHNDIKNHVGETRYAKIVDYAEYNWSREEVLKAVFAQDEDLSDVFLTMMLIVSARAVYVKTHAPANIPGLAYWLTSMLTINGDSRLWEIVALAPALENYDVGALEDLMHTKFPMEVNDRHVSNFIYIDLFINGLAAFMIMEEVGKEDIDDLYENLDIKTKRTADVHQLMTELIEMISENYEDEEDEEEEGEDGTPPGYTIPQSVIREMVQRWSEPRLSGALSLAIPVLADGYAALEGHEIGTTEWSAYRKNQINEILDYIDDIAPGVQR